MHIQVAGWDNAKQLFCAKPLPIEGVYETDIYLTEKDERAEEHGGKPKRARKAFKIFIKPARQVNTSALHSLVSGKFLFCCGLWPRALMMVDVELL